MSETRDDQKDGKPKPEADGGAADKLPGAGPHATPELTNEDLTPGAGSLPDERDAGDDAGAG